MKTVKLFAIFATISASTFVGASTVTISGSSTERVQISGFNSDDDVVLDSSTSANFAGAGKTMKSLSSAGDVSIALPGNNLLGNLIDINTASGTVSAVDIEGAFSMNYSVMEITNSHADSTAVATVTFGSLSLISGSVSPNDQMQSIKFENVNAVVNTVSGATIGNNHNDGKNISTISVGQGANVTWNGAQAYGLSGRLIVNGTFTTNDTPTFDPGSLVTIGSGGTMNLSTFVVFGGLESIGNLNQLTADGIGFRGGVANIYEDAVWNVRGKLHIYSGADVSIYSSHVTLSYATEPRVLLEGGKLSLYANLIPQVEIGSNINIGILGTQESTLVVGADVSFGYINQMSNVATNIILSDGGILRLVYDNNPLTLQSEGLRIFNFEENKVYVGLNVTPGELGFIKLYAGTDLESFIGTAKLTSDGWLTAIPEPAEWAAVLCAVALAAISFRKRKN